MILPTSFSCPACGGSLALDEIKAAFICHKCFISYKDNEKIIRFLANRPTKVVKISEGETYENQKTSQGVT